ncbi:MAG TPA: PIG-L deacetylase family protein [Candidatus Binatia bacterium]|nr:PIG-L deacetylase family protein [Candidatus Sulfotelmatobacter sp.]HXJ89611.1 PIG-L deacetylase family protein [Candidatus Binatia bacterium]
MNRRSFAQSVGGAIALSALPGSSRWNAPADSSPARTMAIAAHPGDGLFTMGAVLAQQIERGGAGTLLSLSLGEKGAPNEIPVQQYGEMQRTATQKATHLLGADSIFLTYPDAEIPFNEESTLSVCDAIRQCRPDIIVTHWSGSWHKDHQNCHLIVRDAVFYAALETLSRSRPAHTVSKIYYADNWEDATNFVPDTYLDIEAVFEKWLQACDFYPMWRGQTGFFRYNDYYGALAIMRGCLSGFKHAVALMSDIGQRTSRLRTL